MGDAVGGNERRRIRRGTGLRILGSRDACLARLGGACLLERPDAESIAQSFPTLSLEQVYGAITFYLGRREEIDRYLARRRADYDVARDEARASDPAFYAKLGALQRS